MLNDVFDPKPTNAPKIDTGEIGRKFLFRGVELKPFAWHYCYCFWRFERSKFTFENAALLLYLLTLAPAKVAALRTEEQQNQARLDAFEWIQTFGKSKGPIVDDEIASEAIATLNEIEEDYRKAVSVESKPSGAAPPNA